MYADRGGMMWWNCLTALASPTSITLSPICNTRMAASATARLSIVLMVIATMFP